MYINQKVPEDTLEDIKRYVNHHIHPGNFLFAVLTNNLTESFARADDNNIENMWAIVNYCYNHIPINCWGNERNVKRWLGLDND